ncbi:MAG: hypothetical protein HQK76_12570 [Desulfobacterales bacterium]|nr:hypothetical protein [Desulfobacterales bacterium]
MNNIVQLLIEKGVKIYNPDSVYIDDDIDIERISGKNVIIYSGCKIFGKETYIMHGCNIGYEAPVTIEDCQLGPDVHLKGGFFRKSVFLKGSSCGLGSHVREGTILEEFASIAHTVGLKQTILFPFATIGSLVNFCDCLLTGGTSKKDHSEIGSSYIHFNYTPHQDKATPSLLGDVPMGVMLDKKPIFLGGQGGLVGPCRLNFGTVTAAGTICRKDELRESRLIYGGINKEGNVPYSTGKHQNLKRILKNNLIYIGNLFALFQWYDIIRSKFFSDDFTVVLLNGAKTRISEGINERIKRLYELIEKNGNNEDNSNQLKNELYQNRDNLKACLNELISFRGINDRLNDFMDGIEKLYNKNYIQCIKGLDSQTKEFGTLWLNGIVSKILDETQKLLPSFQIGEK